MKNEKENEKEKEVQQKKEETAGTEVEVKLENGKKKTLVKRVLIGGSIALAVIGSYQYGRGGKFHDTINGGFKSIGDSIKGLFSKKKHEEPQSIEDSADNNENLLEDRQERYIPQQKQREYRSLDNDNNGNDGYRDRGRYYNGGQRNNNGGNYTPNYNNKH